MDASPEAPMNEILDAILASDTAPEEFAALRVPESYRAVTVRKDEAEMFAGLTTREKDPRKSLHVDEVPVPELGPGEALVAVMASSVNYNSVWTSIFEPLPTFGFLERYGKLSPWPSGTTCRTTSSARTSRASCCAPAPV
ncbi:hypothetical protein SVIO_081810 [Streptomyces violaceusniger]|uniref:Uncharacterized protein n=1 Tax=Streptomyces violaceusniger TaxID=68280 RepID=A0A4D4LGC9_STRVO|nr:hypothetical protein SVIO_081810 [Streptomyces violaceusniger]